MTQKQLNLFSQFPEFMITRESVNIYHELLINNVDLFKLIKPTNIL